MREGGVRGVGRRLSGAWVEGYGGGGGGEDRRECCDGVRMGEGKGKEVRKRERVRG